MAKRKAAAPQRSLDEIKVEKLEQLAAAARSDALDLQSLPGLACARRACEIAAVGGHAIALQAHDNVQRQIRFYLAAVFAAAMPGATVVCDPAQAEMVVDVDVTDADFVFWPPNEPTAVVAARVAEARTRERPEGIDCNATAFLQEAQSHGVIDDTSRETVLSIARSLAAMNGATSVKRAHVVEALCYRRPSTLPTPSGSPAA